MGVEAWLETGTRALTQSENWQANGVGRMSAILGKYRFQVS
jgi:hypothetical protein